MEVAAFFGKIDIEVFHHAADGFQRRHSHEISRIAVTHHTLSRTGFRAVTVFDLVGVTRAEQVTDFVGDGDV